ncbi:hypothetical protein FQR65_LT15209 [Abscondita terminalis]|nr:hypothetical protein FQR65_LT15209 [Abscondita terminalis]
MIRVIQIHWKYITNPWFPSDNGYISTGDVLLEMERDATEPFENKICNIFLDHHYKDLDFNLTIPLECSGGCSYTVFMTKPEGGFSFQNLITDGDFLDNDTEKSTPPWSTVRELQQAVVHYENDEENEAINKWLKLLISSSSIFRRQSVFPGYSRESGKVLPIRSLTEPKRIKFGKLLGGIPGCNQRCKDWYWIIHFCEYGGSTASTHATSVKMGLYKNKPG